MSKPNIVAGFKAKINSQTKTEDDSLTTNLSNPKTDKYPKSTEPRAPNRGPSCLVFTTQWPPYVHKTLKGLILSPSLSPLHASLPRYCQDASLPPAPPAVLSLSSGLQETTQPSDKEDKHPEKNPKYESC